MPKAGIEKVNHQEILSCEQVHTIARAAFSTGVEKVRATGGALLRKGIVPFLPVLSGIARLKQLVLTGNGVLLEEMAAPCPEPAAASLQECCIYPHLLRMVPRRHGSHHGNPLL